MKAGIQSRNRKFILMNTLIQQYYTLEELSLNFEKLSEAMQNIKLSYEINDEDVEEIEYYKNEIDRLFKNEVNIDQNH